MAPKMGFGSFFYSCHFWAIFPPISGRGPFSIFSAIFAHFRHSPRFPFYARRLTRQSRLNISILNLDPKWESAKVSRKGVSVALPAEPRGEKKLYFVQILGGEKLLKFGEKWAVKYF